jgi:hypothetical protein
MKMRKAEEGRYPKTRICAYVLEGHFFPVEMNKFNITANVSVVLHTLTSEFIPNIGKLANNRGQSHLSH